MKALFSLLLGTVLASADSTESVHFVFEGEVVQVEPGFQETIKLDEVLSGTLGWMPGRVGYSSEAGSATFTKALLDAEFTLDEHFVMSYAGSLSSYNNYVILNDVEAGDGTDNARIYMPMILSEPTEGDFHVVLLDIVLRDTDGKMLKGLSLPEKALDFENAWFILSALQEGDWVTMAQGRITLFDKLDGPVQFEPDMDDLKGMVRALDEALAERDALIAELEAQVALSAERIAALEEKVSLLEQALSEAAGTAQAAELEKQNALLRAQLRGATEQQVATADVIAKLKQSESTLSLRAKSYEAQIADLRAQLNEAQAKRQAASRTAAIPPMLARENPRIEEPPAFIQVSETGEARPVEQIEEPEELSMEVTIPSRESTEEALEASTPVVVRRGPRR